MFKFWGKVKKGKGRGKDLGFPTANIDLHKKIPEGVYISLVKINKKQIPSLTFIGTAKTFNETKYQAESYLLDFKSDLYGKYISIYLINKIRTNLKFNTVESLVAQIKKDETIARAFFRSSKTIDKNMLARHISNA